MNYSLSPLGDESIIIELGEEIKANTQKNIQVIASHLEKHPFPGMVEYTPAYTTLTIFYDVMKVQFYKEAQQISTNTSPYQLVKSWVEQLIAKVSEKQETSSRFMEIPVCYGADYGLDLGIVAEHNGMTEDEVINIHSSRDYLVYMIGFAPGFPYIGGMSEQIATPRKESPRLTIPKGSVGIAGMQTGVYPIETPGGWQLIGKTPIEFFRPEDPSPSLLQPGDTIRFYPISKQEYQNWEDGA